MNYTDIRGLSHDHSICLDWDGTLVENKWPEMGDWMPGAVEAVKKFHAAGFKLFVFSARLNPRDPWSGKDRGVEALVERQKVRDKLDDAGLTYVAIYTAEGKPGATVYIDDRAERYGGRPGSWAKLSEKLLLKLKNISPELPPDASVFNREEFDAYLDAEEHNAS